MKKIGIYGILIISLTLTSIIYASYSTSLQISGTAYLRAKNDIRITNIELTEKSSGSYETYNNQYTANTTSLFVTLPANSSMTYEITITNKYSKYYELKTIQTISNTNSNVGITKGIEEGDLIDPSKDTKFTIKLENNTSSQQVETLVLQYQFDPFVLSADKVNYTNSSSTKCSTTKTVKCALDELRGIIK